MSLERSVGSEHDVSVSSGGLGFIFGMSCRAGYGYLAKGFGPWAVRA